MIRIWERNINMASVSITQQKDLFGLSKYGLENISFHILANPPNISKSRDCPKNIENWILGTKI